MIDFVAWDKWARNLDPEAYAEWQDYMESMLLEKRRIVERYYKAIKDWENEVMDAQQRFVDRAAKKGG